MKSPPAYFPQRIPSGFPSFTSSFGDTEDLYCDDELDPNLENDPNMRLYTESINNTDADFFNLGDEGNDDDLDNDEVCEIYS